MRSLYVSKVDYNTKIATRILQQPTSCMNSYLISLTEAASYRNKDPAKVLRQQEEEKKRKYLIPCQQAHKHFTPLVYSVDGLEGKEAAAMRKQLASRLSAKWGRKCSQVCWYLRSRLAIALVRATTNECLRGTRDPTRRTIADDIDWVSYQGLRLYH